MEEFTLIRNSLHIDPHLDIWGWEIFVYLFLGGLAAGVMIISAVDGLGNRLQRENEEQSRWSRWAVFFAPVVISVGMLALFLDLEHKLYVWRFYTAFRITSPMSWGAWILLGLYPASILLGLASLKDDEVNWLAKFAPVRWFGLGGLLRRFCKLGRKWRRFLLWANFILGLGLGVYTGILLGSLGVARPAWNSAILGPLFLVSGFSTGAALLMLFPLNHHEHGRLRRWDAWAIALELALLGLFFIGLASGDASDLTALGMFFGGKLTALFWSLVVALGLLAPLSIEFLEGHRGIRPTALAPVLLLLGGLSLRWIMVLAGLS